MSRLTEHSQAVLDRMLKEAKHDAVGQLMWEGSLAALVNDVAPPSQYSNILKKLKGSGIIVQVQRGGGGSPSRWAITDTKNTTLTDDTPTMEGLERRRTLETRVEDLEKLVGGIDVAQAIRDILERVDKGGTS